MSMRVRWFGCELNQQTLRKLADAMLRDEYSAQRMRGFRLESVRRDAVNGSFIERVEFQESVQDPFGEVMTFPRVEFRMLRFRLSLGQLELLDAPRNSRTFFKLLSEYSGHDLTIANPEVSLARWMTALEASVPRVVVHEMHVRNIALSEAVSAKMIVSGVSDVRRATKQLVGGKQATIERVGVSWSRSGERVECRLYEGARAAILTDASEAALPVLRATLVDAAK